MFAVSHFTVGIVYHAGAVEDSLWYRLMAYSAAGTGPPPRALPVAFSADETGSGFELQHDLPAEGLE